MGTKGLMPRFVRLMVMSSISVTVTVQGLGGDTLARALSRHRPLSEHGAVSGVASAGRLVCFLAVAIGSCV